MEWCKESAIQRAKLDSEFEPWQTEGIADFSKKNVIGGWLRDRSLGKYSVPQEEELADRKKPDLRLRRTGFEGPVPIELKIANNWSGPDLLERLKNQLCGQYLRDQRSNCGIFLLVYLGDKNWQHPRTKKKINFAELLKFLEKEGNKIIAKNHKIESIQVIGIDLTKRNQPALII